MNSGSDSKLSLLLLFFSSSFFLSARKIWIPAASIHPSLPPFFSTPFSHITSLVLIALLWLSPAQALVLLPQDVPDSGRSGSAAHGHPPPPHLWVPGLGGNQDWVIGGALVQWNGLEEITCTVASWFCCLFVCGGGLPSVSIQSKLITCRSDQIQFKINLILTLKKKVHAKVSLLQQVDFGSWKVKPTFCYWTSSSWSFQLMWFK